MSRSGTHPDEDDHDIGTASTNPTPALFYEDSDESDSEDPVAKYAAESALLDADPLGDIGSSGTKR